MGLRSGHVAIDLCGYGYFRLTNFRFGILRQRALDFARARTRLPGASDLVRLIFFKL